MQTDQFAYTIEKKPLPSHAVGPFVSSVVFDDPMAASIGAPFGAASQRADAPRVSHPARPSSSPADADAVLAQVSEDEFVALYKAALLFPKMEYYASSWRGASVRILDSNYSLQKAMREYAAERKWTLPAGDGVNPLAPPVAAAPPPPAPPPPVAPPPPPPPPAAAPGSQAAARSREKRAGQAALLSDSSFAIVSTPPRTLAPKVDSGTVSQKVLQMISEGSTPLRRTTVQRSPGGTPARVRRSPRELTSTQDIIHSALKKKFMSTYSPGSPSSSRSAPGTPKSPRSPSKASRSRASPTRLAAVEIGSPNPDFD